MTAALEDRPVDAGPVAGALPLPPRTRRTRRTLARLRRALRLPPVVPARCPRCHCRATHTREGSGWTWIQCLRPSCGWWAIRWRVDAGAERAA